MNKLIILLAFVAVACASPLGPSALDEERSELSLNPTDDMETEKLTGTNVEAFRDFCIRTRDTVIGDMKNRGNVFASDVFATIFRSLGEVAQSSINANTKSTEILSRQLANPSTPIEETNQEEVDKIIAEGQKAIQAAERQPQGFFAAFMSGVKSFATAGYGEAVAKILELQSQLGAKTISENLVGFCEQLSSYESEALEIFDETKRDLVAENAEQYQSVKYSDVAPKCITANRLTRADGFCKFVLAAKKPLAKILGFELPEDKSEQ